MENSRSKFFLFIFMIAALCWLGAGIMKHYYTGNLLEFGTVILNETLTAETERAAYIEIAKYSVIVFVTYPLTILSGIGYLTTTKRTIKNDGWLLMSTILILMFVPVELYCFWLDWKIVGLNYWGEWPLEEFRKAFLIRLTALAGLPFIAQLCYYTIPILLIFKPFRKSTPSS
jgi:hypothetical protein